MGLTSRWTDGTKGGRSRDHRADSTPVSRPEGTTSAGSSGYSLQGEEDLFRDPFADFPPSGR